MKRLTVSEETVMLAIYRLKDNAYSVTIHFGTDPERVEKLIRVIFQEIETFKREGATADELRDAKQAMFRSYETGIKQNQWLLTQLYYRYLEGVDLGSLFGYLKSLDDLTAEVIHEAAKTYLDTENYVQVILYPEK